MTAGRPAGRGKWRSGDFPHPAAALIRFGFADGCAFRNSVGRSFRFQPVRQFGDVGRDPSCDGKFSIFDLGYL